MGSEDDVGSELSDGTEGGDEEGHLEEGSGENAAVGAASCVFSL